MLATDSYSGPFIYLDPSITKGTVVVPVKVIDRPPRSLTFRKLNQSDQYGRRVTTANVCGMEGHVLPHIRMGVMDIMERGFIAYPSIGHGLLDLLIVNEKGERITPRKPNTSTISTDISRDNNINATDKQQTGCTHIPKHGFGSPILRQGVVVDKPGTGAIVSENSVNAPPEMVYGGTLKVSFMCPTIAVTEIDIQDPRVQNKGVGDALSYSLPVLIKKIESSYMGYLPQDRATEKITPGYYLKYPPCRCLLQIIEEYLEYAVFDIIARNRDNAIAFMHSLKRPFDLSLPWMSCCLFPALVEDIIAVHMEGRHDVETMYGRVIERLRSILSDELKEINNQSQGNVKRFLPQKVESLKVNPAFFTLALAKIFAGTYFILEPNNHKRFSVTFTERRQKELLMAWIESPDYKTKRDYQDNINRLAPPLNEKFKITQKHSEVASEDVDSNRLKYVQKMYDNLTAKSAALKEPGDDKKEKEEPKLVYMTALEKRVQDMDYWLAGRHVGGALSQFLTMNVNHPSASKYHGFIMALEGGPYAIIDLTTIGGTYLYRESFGSPILLPPFLPFILGDNDAIAFGASSRVFHTSVADTNAINYINRAIEEAERENAVDNTGTPVHINKESKKVILLNLPKNTVRADILEMLSLLQGAENSINDVEEVIIPGERNRDPHEAVCSKGICFVKFKSNEITNKVIAAFARGVNFQGRSIMCEYARVQGWQIGRGYSKGKGGRSSSYDKKGYPDDKRVHERDRERDKRRYDDERYADDDRYVEDKRGYVDDSREREYRGDWNRGELPNASPKRSRRKY